MKIFIWTNRSFQSDFAKERNIRMPNSSDYHSGGIVVLAETIKQAIELAKKEGYTNGIDPIACKDSDDEWPTDPVIIDLDKPGVVLYCDGDC